MQEDDDESVPNQSLDEQSNELTEADSEENNDVEPDPNSSLEELHNQSDGGSPDNSNESLGEQRDTDDDNVS